MRCSLAASVCYLWWETNQRVSQNKSMTAEVFVDSIANGIRYFCCSRRSWAKNQRIKDLCDNWGIPGGILHITYWRQLGSLRLCSVSADQRCAIVCRFFLSFQQLFQLSLLGSSWSCSMVSWCCRFYFLFQEDARAGVFLDWCFNECVLIKGARKIGTGTS